MIFENHFNMKKTIIGFILFGTHFSLSSFAQDSLKSFSISYNIIQACINEQSLYAEFSPFRHHSFGVSVGQIINNRGWEVFPLSPSQNEFPGTVYRGNVYRIKYSYVFQKKRSLDYYISTQYIYKDMYYNNKDFRDGGDSYRDYSRNEKAKVFGFDLVYGLNWYLSLNKHFAVLTNYYTGLGWRERHRTIETYYLNNHGGPGPHEKDPPRLGNETKTQRYLIPVIGLKFGLQFRI